METDRSSRRHFIAAASAAAALSCRSASAADETLSWRTVATGLKFPEGPIAFSDGSLIVCEIPRGMLTKVGADGIKEDFAHVGGGPNGAALGPDGACYVCNNGGLAFEGASAPQKNGSIQRVDVSTGGVTTLYESVGAYPLIRPNDIVFDGNGGFWFTDNGKARARSHDFAGVYWAKADGSQIREVIYPLTVANGIALSPDGGTLYVAEGKLCAYRIVGDGEVEMEREWVQWGRKMTGLRPKAVSLAWPEGDEGFDSMKVEAGGRIVVGTISSGRLTVVTPDGMVERISMPDPMPTNLAFGGPELRTLYVCLSAKGEIAAAEWPRPGLALHHAI